MSRFDLAIPGTLAHEGSEFTYDVRDPGGATKFGISLKFYKATLSPDANQNTIRNLNLLTANRIYEQYFWDANNYQKIDNQTIASKAFDLAVNIGNHMSNHLLQESVNIVNNDQALSLDGRMGDKSIEAVNKCNSKLLIAAYRAKAADYYRSLVLGNPRLQPFLKGWLNRAAS